EFRLHLRIDNADQRMTPIGRRLGLVDDHRWSIFETKQQQKEIISSYLERSRRTDWLRRPKSSIRSLNDLPIPNPIRGVLDTIETEVKYAGYIAQQHRQVQRLRGSELRRIPSEFAFSDVPG